MTAYGHILYGPEYTPPAGDQVDFVFDVYSDTEGNYFDLPLLGVYGYASAEERVMGDVVLKMPYITGGADGARDANGILTLPALTLETQVVVNNPLALPALIVSGWTGVSGEVLLPATKVTGSASQVFTVGRVRLPSLAIAGTAQTPWVGSGQYLLKRLIISGWTGLSADYSLPKVAVQGHAITQAPARGRYILPALKVSGAAVTPIMANGRYLLPSCVISGTAILGPIGSGQYHLPAVVVAGTAHVSPAGDRTGEYVLPKIGVQGFVHNHAPPYIIRHRRFPCSVS